MAEYRLQGARERIPQGRWRDGSYARSPFAPLLSRQAHEPDQITHDTPSKPPGSYPPYFYGHVPIKGQGPRSMHTMYPPFGPISNYAINRDSGLHPTHSPRDQNLPGSTPSASPVDQSSLSKQTTGTIKELPWDFINAGKVRKFSRTRNRRHAPNPYSSSPISPAPAPPLPPLEQHDSSSSSKHDQRSTAATSVSSSRFSIDIEDIRISVDSGFVVSGTGYDFTPRNYKISPTPSEGSNSSSSITKTSMTSMSIFDDPFSTSTSPWPNLSIRH